MAPEYGNSLSNAPCELSAKPDSIKDYHQMTLEHQDNCMDMLNALASDLGVRREENAEKQLTCNMSDIAILIRNNAREMQALIAQIRDILI